MTSATMDAQKFADFFGNVPTFQVRVITFVRSGVQLEWVKKFVSVLCLEASRASTCMFVCLFHVLAYISWWLRQKGFLASRACKKKAKNSQTLD